MAQSQSESTIPNAQAVIKRFGGIRPMATKLGIAPTTVQGWGKRNAIPENRRGEIIKAAAQHDVSLNGLKGFAATATKKTAPAPAKPKKTPTQVKNAQVKNTGKTAPAKKPAQAKAPAKTAPRAKIQAAVQPAQQPQPATEAANQDTGKTGISVAELEAVRRESLRSGAVAATLIAGVITVTGLALFGGGSSTTGMDPQRVAQLETRINTIEAGQMGLDQRLGQVDRQTHTALSLLGATETGQVQTESLLSEGSSVLETMAFLQKQVEEMGQSNPDSKSMSRQFEQLSRNAATQNALQSGLQELKSLVSNVQNQVQTLGSEVETTQAQISQAVGGANGKDVQAAALLLALGQFRSAVNRNGPFDQDLQIIRGLVGDNAELNTALDRLAPHAETGVLSVDGLGAQLRVLAGDVIVAKLAGEETSLKDRMVQRLNDMVSVSKDGQPVNQNAPTPEIARAQSELARGNIAAAMREVQSIQDVDPQLTQPWLEQAQATMQAQGVEIMIMQLVLDQVQAFKEGGLRGLERSISSAVQNTVRDANRVLTNPAINLPPIELPSAGNAKPDIAPIDVNPNWQ